MDHKRRRLPRWLLLLVVVGMLSAVMAPAVAADEFTEGVAKSSHKVVNKWDHSGSFTAHPGYNWAGLAEGAEWTYRVHIKESMDPTHSVGTVHFTTGDIDVVGQVKETSRDYVWADLAAFGTADYDGTTYYFMFFEVDYAMWFALSTEPYADYSGTAYPSSVRAFQLHSLNPGTTLTLDFKAIR